MTNLNTQTSVVDFLKSQGKSSSFSERAKLAVSSGIVKTVGEYTGSASQNNRLLSSLQTPAPSAPSVSPSPNNNRSSNISSIEDADRFINEGNEVQEERAPVRTSFQRSQNFFDEINQVIRQDLGERPDAPDFREIFDTQREAFGLDALESNIADLQRSKREVEARLRQRTNAEEGKTVPLNVIQGRVDETTRQERENLDFLSREIEYNSNLASNAYNAIDTIISLEEKSFNAANSQYTAEFNERKSLFQIATDLESTEYTREQEAVDNARANGEIIVNTAIKSGKSFAELDTTTQLSLQRMGVQSGLGRNFFESMFDAAANEGKEILTHVTSKDKNLVTVVYKDGSTNSIPIAGGGTGSGSGAVGETLSTLDISRLSDLYGVTFQLGTTDLEAQKFLSNNAGKSPIEMQELIDNGQTTAGTPTPTTTSTGNEPFTLSRGFFIDTFNEEQLKDLADKTGNSSMWTGKRKDIDRFLDDYMGRIELLRSEGYSDYEIAGVLEEQLGVTF